jgi:hypothetical protein
VSCFLPARIIETGIERAGKQSVLCSQVLWFSTTILQVEDLAMKKLIVLSVVVAFAFLGTQAFASPPIKPPVEGFVIHSFTDIVCDVDATGRNSVTESESFDWTYYEGWGTGPFYPNNYAPSACTGTNCTGVVSELGFSEGAQIAYKQTFEAQDGHTEFQKTFDAQSSPESGDNNLVVSKKIDFLQDPITKGYATHEEKVGLSVISMGAASSTGNPASGLLTLCPWASNGSGTSGGGYPPTNEGIAAGSSFNVTKLVGFTSDSVVNSSINPALSYDVTGQGEGTISAAFVVELWEGPAGYVWAPVKVSGLATTDPLYGCFTCAPTKCDPSAGANCYMLPGVAYGEPPLASRTSYSEKASATGIWTFQECQLRKQDARWRCSRHVPLQPSSLV